MYNNSTLQNPIRAQHTEELKFIHITKTGGTAIEDWAKGRGLLACTANGKWVCRGVITRFAMVCHHAISLNFMHFVRVTCWTRLGKCWRWVDVGCFHCIGPVMSSVLGLRWGRFHSEYGARGLPGSPWHHPFPKLPSSLRHRCLAKHLGKSYAGRKRYMCFSMYSLVGAGNKGRHSKSDCISARFPVPDSSLLSTF